MIRIVICPDCKRYVADKEHGKCDGNAHATCVTYGCGRVVAQWRLEEIGDGRRVNLGYCASHQK